MEGVLAVIDWIVLLFAAVLDSVNFLGALAVVETVECANEIAGNAANALEGHRLPMICHIDKIAVQNDINSGDHFVGIFFTRTFHIGFYLGRREFAAGHLNVSHKNPSYI